MKITRASGLVLAATTGLAGVGVGATLGPAAASAASSSTTAVGDRVTAIKQALAGLVTDGTITQSQADKVATTLADELPQRGPGFGGHGFGRFGAGLDTAASVIGVTEDELRTALESGKTLAQVAEGKGISQDALVDELVAAAKAELAEAVTAGRLTQAQSDSISAGLEARITAQVTSTRPLSGPGGRGHRFGGGPKSGTSPSAPSPSTSPSTSPSAGATTS
ncbi:hypothetical protein [Motilibacter aurantiacus]|uniref:hypothetical protein n=1 Tax=Motilibacter aurantiacus TaxID=2714955 RepID=UPI0014087318|nr:hypothetical protein [Motilibacter aurantiacus]NHC47276.1 hypothetical protein [Motilibacter aurantiacus]